VQCPPIAELRQYTLLPGKRDVLIELFEREFIESQEVLGMPLIGTFRDFDDPSKFVWLRGFASMDARPGALGDFYGGPVWKANRDVANGTMIDSDDVLLLRSADREPRLQLGSLPPRDAALTDSRGFVDLAILHLQGQRQARSVGTGILSTSQRSTRRLVRTFEKALAERFGGTLLGSFVTEPSKNNFPALPIRNEANVIALLIGYEEEPIEAVSTRRARLEEIATAFPVPAKAELLHLEPTRRSRLNATVFAEEAHR